MNEAIGNALLTKISIFIIFVVMLLFVGVIAYSKAYKTKNSIINAIERNGDYDLAIRDIEDALSNIGYRIGNFDCTKVNEYDNWKNQGFKLVSESDFTYCVYKKCMNDELNVEEDECDEKGEYYKVVTFMEINLPIVGALPPASVVGETKTLNKNYDY